MSRHIELPGVLDDALLREVGDALAAVPLVDGRASAGPWAARVKRNEEAAADLEAVRRLGERVYAALGADPVFRSAALPHRASQVIFARYRPGMAYGRHIDDPVMGTDGARLRTDVAITVFLNDPAAYTGGALCIHAAGGSTRIKLPAGHAVLYPAQVLHEVEPVDEGERLVAVLWIQSLVRDPVRRELLLDLDLARSELRQAAPDAHATARVDNAYANLVRLWAEV